MSVPKFEAFLGEFLKAISDGEIHSSKEVKRIIASNMEIESDDLKELLPSGRQTRFDNRVDWASTYLDKAELIEKPSKGKYRITAIGKEALDSGETVNVKLLSQYDKFREFHKIATSEGTEVGDNAESESPTEILDSAFQQINSSLASQLMDEVMKLSSTEFERLVVQLLLAMGYGSGIDKAGFVTKASNDGGIDGIIKEDQLGFSNIYIQAKQWAKDSSVGRPDIQKFVGALQGKQAQKGLFITTAKFSNEALQYAENLLGAKVVLIDGDALMRLMIKHDVGVSVEQVYKVKKLDTDFFVDEL